MNYGWWYELFRYLHKQSTIAYTIISAIKWTKYHLSSTILAESPYKAMLFILELMLTARSVRQRKSE